MVDQELLARNEYLAAENRILKAQLKGRLKLSARWPMWPGRTPSWPGTASWWRANSIARRPVVLECLFGALGQVGEGGVSVQGDTLRRALLATRAKRICRAFPCGAESSGKRA